MTVASINPFQPLPPAVGTSYGNIMDAFFSTLSEAEKQAIWVNFLAANNLTDPIPPGSEQLFLTYIQQTLANQQLFVPTFVNDKLSPEEIKKRNIMFGVFNSVLNMLLSLQQTVTVEAQNIAVFAKWQKEYTEMLTRVPTYVGGEGSAVHAIDVNAANPDWSKFTLGYDGISVQDIAKWWANQRAIGGSDSFQISSMISMDVDSNNSGNWTKSYFTVTFSPNSIEVAINNQFSNGTTSGNSLGFVPINVGSTFDQNVANLETAFKNFWNSPPSSFTLQILSGFNPQYLNKLQTFAGISTSSTNTLDQAKLIQSQIFTQSTTLPVVSNIGSLFSILKPYTYVAPSSTTQPTDPLRNLSDSNAKTRGEINSRDQQYIENVRSKRQVVQDQQSALQSNLDQSRQTLSQQTDLANSIIDSLKGLIAAIFR